MEQFFGSMIWCLVILLALYALVILYFWGGILLLAGYALMVHGLLRLAEIARTYEEQAFDAAQGREPPLPEKAA